MTVSTVTINSKELAPGVEVQIAGETFRVMNVYPVAQSVFFAKVLKNGQLARPGKGTMGSYSFDELADYMNIGSIV